MRWSASTSRRRRRSSNDYAAWDRRGGTALGSDFFDPGRDRARRFPAAAASSRSISAGARRTSQGSMRTVSSSRSNSGRNPAMTPSGSGTIPASVMRPNWTPPAYDRIETPIPMSPDIGMSVRQDRDAHPDVPRLRHPEHDLREARAREEQRLLRARDVGHHGGRLAGEEIEHLLLRDAGEATGEREQPERDERLIGGLQRFHAVVDLVQPRERVRDADRQQQGDEPEAVAELAVVLRRGPIYGHPRAPLHAADPIALRDEVAAQRAGGRREQHVVHRAAERPADGLDLVERQRFGPGDDLLRAGLTLEAGARVVRHRRELGDLRRHAPGDPGVLDDLLRVAQERDVLLERFAREPQGTRGRARQRRQQLREEP